MQQIEMLLVRNRAQLFYSLREQVMQISMATSTQVIDFPDFSSQSVKYWKLSPTCHSIEACFLYNFWKKENTYNHLMTQNTLSASSAWLSLDHTFRCVSNIGLVRSADRYWVKQYTGLLCILNADGEVLSWKMTKTQTWKTCSVH